MVTVSIAQEYEVLSITTLMSNLMEMSGFYHRIFFFRRGYSPILRKVKALEQNLSI